MLHRLAALISVSLVTAIGTAPYGLADPPADPNVVPAAAGSAGTDRRRPVAHRSRPAPPVASPRRTAGCCRWRAKDESLEPVASLTNSPWSREYLVDGTFEGAVTGVGQDQAVRRDDWRSATRSAAASSRTTSSPSLRPVSRRASASRSSPARSLPIFLGLSRQRADQDRPQAGHREHRSGGQEVVQGHQVARLDHTASGSRSTAAPASPSSGPTRRSPARPTTPTTS